MKIKSVKIKDKGKTMEIMTDDKKDYKYIWIDAEHLKDIALMLENY